MPISTHRFRDHVLGALLAATACACATEGDPRPQWVVVLSTDAPVPQLGERVLIEVLTDDGQIACDACRRTISTSDAAQWPLSFGVTPPAGGADLWVRAVLYRAVAIAGNGQPDGEAAIEALGRLPASSDAVGRPWLPLDLACFGQPIDFATRQSCDPATGTVAEARTLPPAPETLPLPGSAAAAQPQPCTQTVPDDMVCIDGGLLILGHPRYYPAGTLFLGDDELALDPVPEHLVRVSPFALDRDEMKVKAVRTLRLDGELAFSPRTMLDESHCTYLDDTDPTNDELPVNCVDHYAAAGVCSALGKRLPTEAEWEFAASNGSAESTYPWGNQTTSCLNAHVGRSRVGTVGGDSSCGPFLEPYPDSLRGGTFAADVTFAGVRELGGSLSEWVADNFADYRHPCWHTTEVIIDPLCQTGTEWVSARGGQWNRARYLASGYQRNTTQRSYWGIGRGFRCALDL